MYVNASKPLIGILLKYSEIEAVKDISEVKHPIIRECLKSNFENPQIEITTVADIPSDWPWLFRFHHRSFESIACALTKTY